MQQGYELREPISKKLRSEPDLFELRIHDGPLSWRIIYHVGRDEVVVLTMFKKKTERTPAQALKVSEQRLSRYLAAKG